ncbi:MAG TPA: gamma-glutamyltransferase family protein [Chloroflexota bacterium]|nr:gamma-glutamyltransferase family protein [Chloroflexota bacterium]
MPQFTTRPVITGTHGVVAAGHYLAAAAGLRMLDKGGNAVDAGVAAGLALEVLKPQSTGIGGEVPILIAPVGGWSGQSVVAIKGQGCAPRAATIDWFRREGIDLIPGDGFLPATVPGAFGSWATALLNFGRLSLTEVLEPAIELAEEGFPVYDGLRDVIIRNAEKYAEQWPSTAAIYLPNGKPPANGDVLVQKDWARTFKAVADAEIRNRASGREAGIQAGLDYFYRGPIARQIADFIASTEVLDASGRKHRGLLAYEDFAEYRTNLEAPARRSYRDYVVCKCGPWCQGPVFLQQLALLEGYDLAALGHNSAEYIHLVVEASKLAYADREYYYGDPAFTAVPLERLLSAEYQVERRQLIDRARASLELRPGNAPTLSVEDRTGRPSTFRGDTTHVDAVDAEGNLFAATPSGGWIPSSPVVAGLGFPVGTRGQMFALDPAHPNALVPGKRPRTTLTPSLALRNGEPWLAFGTPGGDQQDQWTLQFFLNVVDFGMDLQAAIDAPTFHSLHWPSSFYPRDAHPGRLVVEGRIGPEVREELAGRGHEVVVTGDWNNGQVSAVELDRRQGVLRGAASPRGMTAYAVGR